ncbi:malonate decarboxylase holo-ACP synthase [Glaciimonas sp. PCH181]|uniref:malonate decarboxylase holo-ACP synthase n=1 Tax=Glaciimonas sp. PCH181 TaxID=2133943 RepID=UPI000D34C855|nr:malonate decarboxylase holo-ACP synthase [Glaciimonas sp. PCH181]PUA18650.1 malonate decarboxylase holo-ACP synthase [Glaciimonas sp. PCH181]
MLKNSAHDDSKSVPRAHDLLWISGLDALVAEQPFPAWVSAEWLERAPVVIRRETVENVAWLPVGLRGKTRSERFKALLSAEAVTKHISPELLVRTEAWNIHSQYKIFPAVEALANMAAAMNALGLDWGPTGSVGFALASGLPVLREDSDLDLVIRTNAPFCTPQCELLQSVCASSACRIDLQIDTGYGGFAFAEWISGRKTVLLKTGIGPFLTADPWAYEDNHRPAAGSAS